MQPLYINFLKIFGKILYRWKRHDEPNSEHLSECRIILFVCSRHILILQNILKNPLRLEASWWAKSRTTFWMSKYIICMQPPYINFLKYYEKSFTVGSVMMSRIQNTFQKHLSDFRSVWLVCSCHILNFLYIMQNALPLEASWWAEYRTLFRMSKCMVCMQPPSINFLRYYEKCYTFESILKSRIQTTVQNVEVYYLVGRHILII